MIQAILGPTKHRDGPKCTDETPKRPTIVSSKQFTEHFPGRKIPFYKFFFKYNFVFNKKILQYSKKVIIQHLENVEIVYPKLDKNLIHDIMKSFEFSENRINNQLDKLDELKKKQAQKTLF